MKYLIVTFGCRQNQAESDNVENWLLGRGWAEDKKSPQIVAINTCTVTQTAERKCRQKTSQLLKKYPNAKIIPWGCGVRFNIDNFPENVVRIKTFLELKKYISGEYPTDEKLKIKKKTHVRSEVIVQSGCENFCSFCAVVLARGRSKNRSESAIIREIKTLEKAGTPEVVITGTNIGAYGCEKTTQASQTKLPKLLKNILKNTEKIQIRLSSLGVQYLTTEMINMFGEERICPYVHISVQSGSDDVLKKMNRPYRAEKILDAIKRIRKIRKDVFVSGDFIVGFPTETTVDFTKTIGLIKKSNFARLHVFPYSKRPNTPAENLKSEVDASEIKFRANLMRDIGETLHKRYLKKYLRKNLKMIVEKYEKGFVYGHTLNYIEIKCVGEKGMVGKVLPVKITKIVEEKTEGILA